MNRGEQDFYEWYHEHGLNAGDVGRLRKVFLAGWDARSAYMLEPDEPDGPPEVDPEDAEAQRIAETYADASAERGHARCGA